MRLDDDDYEPPSQDLFAWIRETYNDTLKTMASRVGNSAWKATFTTLGKGLLYTAGAILIANIGYGAFAGQASMEGMANGMLTGVYKALEFMGTERGLSLLAIGTTIGAVADVREMNFERQALEAQHRQAERTKSHLKQPTVEQEKAQEHSVEPETPQPFDLSHPPVGWAERTKPNNNQGIGR